MINYVIINGVNSNTKNGLMINELPPITKPLMRTETEEIDGRDGDIITKLGYSAYDKTITIGLWGTSYDVNDIIAFFNKEGVITFSNEPDKYYKFTMLDDFDIETLLKFKTATITFHCQPYKYPTSETPIEISYEYVEQENVESANMTNTEGDTFLKISPKGNTNQTGTPTPDSPIPINVVSGDNTIEVCGENVFKPSLKVDETNIYSARCTVSLTDDEFTFTASGTDMYFGNIVGAGTTYQKQFGNLIKLPSSATKVYVKPTNNDFNNLFIGFYDANKISLGFYNATSYTIPSGAAYANIRIGKSDSVNGTTYKTKIMVSFDEISSYQPYTSQTYPISLGTLELCKIGDYKDYFDKTSGKNLFNPNVANQNCSVNNGIITITSNYADVYIEGTFAYNEANRFLTLPAGSYYMKSTNSNIRITFYGTGSLDTDGTQPRTLSEEAKFGGIRVRSIDGTSLENKSFSLMLSTENIGYEPYGTNQWCKYNAIGKVVLDGSENWNYNSNNGDLSIYGSGYLTQNNGGKCFSSHFKGTANGGTTNTNGCMWIGNSSFIVCRETTQFTSASDFKTWLSTHNTIVYYVLENPYLSLITDNTLINQLDNIENAFSYEGTTNVNQINNDKPFLLDLKAMKKDTNETIVNNMGNTTSKPTIALEGTGDINIYLNGTQMLKATLTDKMTIDTNNMEAYNPDTSALLNRHLVGDISKFTLSSGNNTIKMDGDLTKATITDYVRWL